MPLEEEKNHVWESESFLGIAENGRNIGSKRKKGKVIKKKYECPNLILGVNILTEKAVEASYLILVGRVRGKYFYEKYITGWIYKSWCGAPDNQVEVITLARGWFMVQLNKGETLGWVLKCNWCFGISKILFNKWTPLFDAQREKLEEIMVWVHLPTLPP